MSTTNIVAIITALASLSATIPAIIIAVKGNNKANAVSTTVQKEVVRANNQDSAIYDLQKKVNGGT